MQNQQFIIDSRERHFIELLNEKIKQTNNGTSKYKFTTTNLDIGDIIISKNEYQLIIERKCITDLLASIKDGRYREQKLRLSAEQSRSIGKTRFAFLVEGDITSMNISQADKTIIYGAIVSSQFRDNIPILRSFTLTESLDIVLRIYDRFIKDTSDFFTVIKSNIIVNSNSIVVNNDKLANGGLANDGLANDGLANDGLANDSLTNGGLENDGLANGGLENDNLENNETPLNTLYLQSIKKNKKDNLTPNTWFILSLMNIPSVSNTIATKIVELYPTLCDLYNAYTLLQSENEKRVLVANIVLVNNGKTKRRIGNIVSNRIYEYLMHANSR